MKDQFLLNPEIVYLNHGGFGAAPRPVCEAYQGWQRELERQPVEFLDRRLRDLMLGARTKLADYVGCDADEVVYFPNPTTAMNMVAKSLALNPGDEILTTDHEYGAMDRTWRFVCQRSGAHHVQVPIPLPLTTTEEFVEIFWSGVNERTRIIFLSHITSPTALIFPVKEICQRAREEDILCIVDGAHAIGQLPLDLQEIGADIYAGACHKWLCAPKGSAFLYVRREIQHLLYPLVVSWGWESEFPSDSRFVDHQEWQGTNDIAAYLSVPAAIDFQEKHNWPEIRERCHQLAVETRQRINALTGLDPICPDSWFQQMAAIRLPDISTTELKIRLYDDFGIEVPMIRWKDHGLIRVSIQAYNSPKDVDDLHQALVTILHEFT